MATLEKPAERAEVTATRCTDLRVLLIEDSRLLSSRLLELIEQTPGIVALAVVDSEAGAIAAIASSGPHVLILDLNLRQGTGFGVMRHLRTLRSPPVVLVLTNYALPQYRREAEKLGARYFLDKAEEFERLPEVLTEIRSIRNHRGCS